MKLNIVASLAISVVSVFALPALARVITDIEDLLQEETVTISGEVTEIVGDADDNEWVVADNTGSVVVDAGSLWQETIDVSVGDKLTVVGELDENEFDAFTVILADGTEIEIPQD
jgi:uncharacterized protein YdeI (BOF family)